jgi:hypothetical protein
MIIIGPGLGFNEKVSEEHIAKAEEIYQKIHKASQQAMTEGIKQTEAFVKKTLEERERKTKQTSRKSKTKLSSAQTAKPEP